MSLLLRVMVEVATEAEAQEAREALLAILGRMGPVRADAAERYAKIPDYWDVTLRLDPTGSVRGLFDQVLEQAPDGWTVGGAPGDLDRWAVWNASPGSAFLDRRVRWVSLDRMDSASGGGPMPD